MPKPRTVSPPEDAKAVQAIADRLSRLRKEKGWTQGEVAQKVGLSRHMVASIESGRSNLTATTVIRWAAIFGVSTDELLGVHQGIKVFYSPEPTVSMKLMQRIVGISRLPPAKQAAILKTIDLFLIGSAYEESPGKFVIPEKREEVERLEDTKLSKTEKAKVLLNLQAPPSE
jgi:transcriptional regulator with XRE-family HTH domain